MLGYWIVMGMIALVCVRAIASYLRNPQSADPLGRLPPRRLA